MSIHSLTSDDVNTQPDQQEGELLFSSKLPVGLPFDEALGLFQQRALDSAAPGQAHEVPEMKLPLITRTPIDVRHQISRGNQAKRFSDNFDNHEVGRCAVLQLNLMRELSALTESHKALERTLRILKARHRTQIEELVFDEAEGMHPRIFEEGMLYREKLIEFHSITDVFEKAVATEVTTDDSFNVSRVLQWRRDAQRIILETQHGAIMLEQAKNTNKDVSQFVVQYEDALASSDTRLCLRLEAHPIFGLYPDGFKNIEARFDVAKHNGSIVRAKAQRDDLNYFSTLHESYPGFSREDFEYIFSTYGSYYEAALDELKDLYLLAEALRENGLSQASNDLLNLHLKFATIDGTPLGTPSQRIAFYNKMTGLSPLEHQWYSQRPHFDQGGAVLKDFTNTFITTQLIPALSNGTDFSVEQSGLEFHRWLTKGSSAQFDVLLDREYGLDISGVYRSNKVRLENYIPPPPEKVSELMALFDLKIQEISAELAHRKLTMSSSDYENAVIQVALYIHQVYVDIHPMRDGNGRVSRTLCEAFITKYLGNRSSYTVVPVTRDSQGEARAHVELVPFNFRWSDAHRPSQLDHVAFDSVLAEMTLDRVLKHELLIEWRNVFKGLINPNN